MSRGPRAAPGVPASEQLVRRLLEYGWRVEVQMEFECGRTGTCGYVANVIGTLEASGDVLSYVAMVAHYDSVAASPGASDNGLGVAAILEAARVLASGPRLERSLAVIFTDGEEDGLLGALRHHPISHQLVGVINLDARGNAGPSLLFELSADHDTLLRSVVSKLGRPITSSLFYEVYRRLPNDTDFSIFKQRAQGLAFVNVGGFAAYHSAFDRAERLDLGTLQHHGDNVLAAARAFDGTEIAARAESERVWFDLFAASVVSWPARWSIIVALASFAVWFPQPSRATNGEVAPVRSPRQGHRGVVTRRIVHRRVQGSAQGKRSTESTLAG